MRRSIKDMWAVIWFVILTGLIAGLMLRVALVIDDFKAEVRRSVTVDCEANNAAIGRFNRFAAEIVAILTEAGPETEGGRRLVAELENRIARLFPEVEC